LFVFFFFFFLFFFFFFFFFYRVSLGESKVPRVGRRPAFETGALNREGWLVRLTQRKIVPDP
jgi:hypothetical protein